MEKSLVCLRVWVIETQVMDFFLFFFFFFLFSNGSTGKKAGSQALCRFQDAGAGWTSETESQEPWKPTESAPALPTSVL